MNECAICGCWIDELTFDIDAWENEGYWICLDRYWCYQTREIEEKYRGKRGDKIFEKMRILIESSGHIVDLDDL